MYLIPVTNIRTYEHELCNLDLLSKEEEHKLLTDLYDNNDLWAGEKLILHNMRYVFFIAKKYLWYGLPYEDLVQEGTIGLMETVKNFDISRNVKLSTAAVYQIKGKIRDYVTKNWKLVNVVTTKNARKLFFSLRKYKSNDRYLTSDEIEHISNELDVKYDDVVTMEAKLYSNDVPFESNTDDDEFTMSPDMWIVNPTDTDPIVLLENLETSDHFFATLSKVKSSICKLDDRSRDIMTNRWLSQDKITLKELSLKYNVSVERIRQIEKNIIKHLHKELVK